MSNYNSNYDIALKINSVIGNSPVPFDSVNSICYSIYQTLGGTESQSSFDSTYSILEAIVPLADSGGIKVDELLELIDLMLSTGITVETTSIDSLIVNVQHFNDATNDYYGNVSAVVWGDGTFTETDGNLITGGDTTNTTISNGLLTHTYSNSKSYNVKIVGTWFFDTFDTDNGTSQCVKSVYIDKGVEILSLGVFFNQKELKHITFNSECNTKIGQMTFNTYGRIDEIYLPSNIEFTNMYPFLDFYVKSFVFGKPVKLKTIPKYFNYITMVSGGVLEELVIPEGIETIDRVAFATQSPYVNGNMKQVTFPSTLKTINDYAFAHAFKDGVVIDLPASITFIDESAFRRSYKNGGGRVQYTVISRSTTPPTCGTSAFYGVDDEKPTACTLYVPNESVELYKVATGWKEFGTILPIESYNTDVATNAEIDLLFTNFKQSGVTETEE